MNDYQMIHLANSRSLDLHREAQQHRLARSLPEHVKHASAVRRTRPSVPRSTLRLSLDYLLGRVTV